MNLDDKVMVPTDAAIIKKGQIPFVVPSFRIEGRYWGGDDVWRQKNYVLESALKQTSRGAALQVADKWGNRQYALPVAVIWFEDLVKIQRESGFLQGIEGITVNGNLIAINADSVKKSVKPDLFEKYFGVVPSINVHYWERDKYGRRETKAVEDVVLFHYNGSFISLNSDQFQAIDAEAVKRERIPEGDLMAHQFSENGKVIYPYSAILPEDIAVPLVWNTCKFSKMVFEYDTCLGFYPPEQPTGNGAEMRALSAEGLDGGSRLFARNDLSDSDSTLVGIIEKDGESISQKPVEPIKTIESVYRTPAAGEVGL